jgi:hypothetical protein
MGLGFAPAFARGLAPNGPINGIELIRERWLLKGILLICIFEAI